MKTVYDKAAVRPDDCPGCGICVKVCPTIAIHMHKKLAVIAEEHCIGCNACQQACPFDAITMVPAETPTDERTAEARVDRSWDIEYSVPAELDGPARELCRKADLHPDQLLCVCVEGLRAVNVAAKVLAGHVSPDDLALTTGLRSGCTVLCMSGLVRLLAAAGADPGPPPTGGFNWYPGSVTQFDLPDGLDERYGHLGYRFADDRRLLAEIVQRGQNSPPASERS